MSILLQTVSALFSRSRRAKRKAFTFLKSGQYAKAALNCEKVLRADPDDAVALRVLADIADVVAAAADAYKIRPANESSGTFRALRMEFVLLLQSLPADSVIATNSPAIAQAHSSLFDSGLRELPRSVPEETAFRRLCLELNRGENSPYPPPSLLAVMLLGHSFEVPLPENLAPIHENILERYCLFLLDSPQVFQRPGDAEADCDQLIRTLEMFHRESIVNGAINHAAPARTLMNLAAYRLSIIQSYFTTRNLRHLSKMRGDLISAALISAGANTLESMVPRVRPDGKIRLGVLTGSFKNGTEDYFTVSHIDHLDRSKFHIILYVLYATNSPLEQHCIKLADRFEVLPVSDLAEQARRIRADDLDIFLIGANASVITSTPSLLGSIRLARSQVATACSPITTGLRHVDVMLSAQMNEPESDAAEHYTEQLWLMPGSVNCYPYQYDSEVATINFSRTSLGVSNEAIIFFSGANFFKIVPELSATWARILADVPDSVLILMPFNPNWSNSYQTQPLISRIQRQLVDSGVSPARLHVLGAVPTRADVQRIVSVADIYLDAYPFAGACSMLDPMIVGVPPVVRCGPVGRSHHGAALMRMALLDDLICVSEAQYISTAIDLATNPVRRQKIRSRLGEVYNQALPPYFDTRAFSAKVGSALIDIHEQFLARYRAVEAAGPSARRTQLQALADLVVNNNLELAALNDIGIIPSLIKPYFHNRRTTRPHHMIDVGSCFGIMADPLLADGWSADLLEPDPSPRPILERNVQKYGSRCRVFAMAISNGASGEVEFHRSGDGLSGLGESPFKPTQVIIKVPCSKLADFYLEQKIEFVDFLKIDAEGFDFDVLESHNFTKMRPALVMVEYGTHFASESLAVVNTAIRRMGEAGYGSVIFNYDDDGNFSKGAFLYRLTQILLDQPLPDFGRVAFGNILFYQSGDTDFLLALYSLLDVCRPRSEVKLI